jgi:hypothetical protein
MACTLIQGNSIPCRESVGGIAEIYIASLGDKSSITTTSGVITAFTMASGKKFWTYAMERENASFTSTTTVSFENGTKFDAQSGSFMIKQLNSSNRNEIDTLCKSRLMIIAKDNNGVYWLYGEVNGLNVTTSAATTGKAFGDMNGFTITFEGNETAPPKEVTAALLATLTVAA